MRSLLPPLFVRQASDRIARRRGDDASSAELWLGAGHPLTVVLRRMQTVVEQMLTVGVVLGAGWLLSRGNESVALSVTIGAVSVQLVLTCWLLALKGRRRELCLLLIVEGRDLLPLACVDRECRRLRDPRTVKRLGKSLDEIVRIAARPLAAVPASRPLFDVRVIRAVAPELCRLALLLRGDRPCVRGVAAVEWLLTSSATPLYDGDVESLRRELGRARYLLGLRA